MTEMKIGTRKLQKGGGAFVFNVPIVAVRTLGLHTGDALEVSITNDGAIRIKKKNRETAQSAEPEQNAVGASAREIQRGGMHV